MNHVIAVKDPGKYNQEWGMPQFGITKEGPDSKALEIFCEFQSWGGMVAIEDVLFITGTSWSVMTLRDNFWQFISYHHQKMLVAFAKMLQPPARTEKQ